MVVNIDGMIFDYVSGMSLENVALKYRIGKKRLKEIFSDNGVVLRKRGGQKNYVVDYKSLNKPQLKWNYETCKEESKKYSSKTEMQKKNGSAYNAALRYGWLDEFFDNIKKPRGYWNNIENCKNVICECKTISDAISKYPSAYGSIIRNGWQELCGLDKLVSSNRLTTDEFRKLVYDRFGDKYDLSGSIYVNSKTKVTAICKEHGEFSATPYSFLRGVPCKECRNKEMSSKRLSNIEDFKKKYYERFSHNLIFDKSVYVANNVKMVVTCQIHGDFEQTPNKLLNGCGCHECAKINKHNIQTLTQDEFINRLRNVFGDLYDTSLAEYKSIKEPVKLICKEHGVFTQTPDALFHGCGCSQCANQISNDEREIISFVQSIVGEDNVDVKNRELLGGKEIDILVESKKIGIEYNGNYWHCENTGKGRNYHVTKTNVAEEKGYRLIQVFSDEYKTHKDLVFDKIRHFIGCDVNKIKIGARKCDIIEINKDIAREFLNKFHLQGFSNSTLYYGAYYKDNLVAAMTFLFNGNDIWDMNRFTTDINYSIPGIASKMFKHFIRNNNVKLVKSFLDRRWGKVGCNVYEKLGFVVDKIERPDYRYLVNGNRIHKFNFRKKLINKKYGLPMTMTEKEMVDNLGISRIWDCGLIKYVYHNTQYSTT